MNKFYSKELVFMIILSTGCALGDILNLDGKNVFRNDYTYYPNVGYWFKAHPIPVDFHTARLICHFEGAELASPLTPEILAVIKDIVLNHEPKLKVYFSGVHQTFGNGVFASIEGVPLEKLALNNWDTDEPNGFKNQQCIVYSNDGTIWDYNCPESYPFICYRKYSENDVLTECGTVDKAYHLHAGTDHCYKFHKRAEPWERALKICRAEGGDLTIINNYEEAEKLIQLIRMSHRPLYTRYYNTVALGFREWGHTSSWWTVHGQTLEEAGYENWCEDCPNIKEPGSDQNCGGFSNGKLVEVACNAPLAFICEKSRDSINNLSSFVNLTVVG